MGSFKAKLWISYFRQYSEPYKDFLEAYKKGEEDIKKITEVAKQESTKWAEVIKIFNARFFVPFELTIGNQIAVMLEEEEIPVVGFEFKDQESKTVKKSQLLTVLSQGEKRALYVLNIIFEIQARKERDQETLFIVDDIADSFDYKNKYAIIEYLRDISTIPNFYQLVLTHNFDFHRTISNRLNMERKNRLNAAKSNGGKVELIEEPYQKNPFDNWRGNWQDSKKLIASIPFVRNLAEYTGDKCSNGELTSFLHIKEDTANLTVDKLKELFQKVIKNEENTKKLKI